MLTVVKQEHFRQRRANSRYISFLLPKTVISLTLGCFIYLFIYFTCLARKKGRETPTGLYV